METTLEYLTDLRMTTLEYANKWQMVASHISLAYIKAYTKQQERLNAIKKAIEADRKKQEAMMSFTLSLLTGGIVGPIADRIAAKAFKYEKKTAEPGLNEVVPLITRDELLTEWTSSAFKELAKAGDEKLRGLGLDQIKPKEVSGPAFEPKGMTPAEYTERIKLTVAGRADAMSDIARALFRFATSVPPPVAAQMHRNWLTGPFFTSLPANITDLGEAELQRSAEVMLWIAWGKVRDVKYWETQHALRLYGSDMSEVWHWAPLLKELQSIGVPVRPMTIELSTMRGLQRTIDMPKFIQWAKGSTAGTVALAGLPTNEAGKALMELRLTVANSVK